MRAIWLEGWKKFGRARRSHPDFFLQSSRIRVDLLSYNSKRTNIREWYDRVAGKNLDGFIFIVHQINELIYPNRIYKRAEFLWVIVQPLMYVPGKYIPTRPKKFGPPVVLLSFISLFALERKQIDSNTTGSQNIFLESYAVPQSYTETNIKMTKLRQLYINPK